MGRGLRLGIDRTYLHLATGNDIVRPDNFINPIDNYRETSAKERRRSFSHPLVDQQEPTTYAHKSVTAYGDEDLHTIEQLATGMTIEHSRFGRGVITDIDTAAGDARIEVSFNTLGVKKLLLKFARFKIIG